MGLGGGRAGAGRDAGDWRAFGLFFVGAVLVGAVLGLLPAFGAAVLEPHLGN